MRLEAQYRALSGAADRDMLTRTLMDKIRSLGMVPPTFTEPDLIPMFPMYNRPEVPKYLMSSGTISTGQDGVGYTPVVTNATLGELLSGLDPKKGEVDQRLAVEM